MNGVLADEEQFLEMKEDIKKNIIKFKKFYKTKNNIMNIQESNNREKIDGTF